MWGDRVATDAVRWGFEGRDRFISGLKIPANRALYEERAKGDPVLLAYGASQVGKTELILRLLGVDLGRPDLAATKRALRGGRELGMSASSTATIYRMSPDEAYYLRTAEGHSGPLDVTALERSVADVRKHVEGGRFRDEAPIEVWLPAGLARDPVIDGTRQVIIDLPGVGSATAAEAPEVNRLLRRYLPVASVVMMVFQADQSSALGQIREPELELWYVEPGRIRVVLTRAVSFESVRRMWERNREATGATLHAHVRDQIRSSVKRFPEDVRLYPVEYGESWAKLSKENHELWRHFSPIVEANLRSLGSDLPAPTPEQGLLNLVSAHHVIEARAKEKMAVFSSRKAEMSERRKRWTDERTLAQALAARAEATIATARAVRAAAARFPAPALSLAPLSSSNSQDAGDFRGYLDACEADLLSQAAEYRRAAHANEPSLKLGVVDPSDDTIALLAATRAGLDYTFFDRYATDAGQDEDRVNCREVMRAMRDDLNAGLHEQRKVAVSKIAGKAKALAERATAERASQQGRDHDLAVKISMEDAAIHALDTEAARYEEEMAADVSRAQEFRESLSNALDGACARWIQEINRPSVSGPAKLEVGLLLLQACKRAETLHVLQPETHS